MPPFLVFWCAGEVGTLPTSGTLMLLTMLVARSYLQLERILKAGDDFRMRYVPEPWSGWFVSTLPRRSPGMCACVHCILQSPAVAGLVLVRPEGSL